MEEVLSTLAGGGEQRGQDGRDVGPGPGAVATGDLAVDDGRTEILLGGVVGGRDIRAVEEDEQAGAMLYQASKAIRAVVPNATIYAGCLAVQHNRDTWQDRILRATDFLNEMYTYLRDPAVFPPLGADGYGWDALGINIEGIFNYDYPQALFNALTQKQRLYGDRPSIVVGEWGTQNENFSLGDQDIENMYLGIRFYFPTMYFFSHFWVPEDGSYGTMELTNLDPPSNINPVTHEYEVGDPKKWRVELRNNLYPIF